MKRVLTVISVACFFMLCVGCSATQSATNFNGLSTPDGKVISHLSSSNLAIHLLAKQPLFGNATLERTVDDFTKAAKQENATQVRIVQSRVIVWWFIFPPFSLVLTPVSSNVAGDALL